MQYWEHIGLTGHMDFTPLTYDQMREIGRDRLGRELRPDDGIPEFWATCDECGYPIGESPLLSCEEEFIGTDDWLVTLKAQYYVDQIELSANGYDERIPLGWKESYGQSPSIQDR